jgi:hypothetical protein
MKILSKAPKYDSGFSSSKLVKNSIYIPSKHTLSHNLLKRTRNGHGKNFPIRNQCCKW